MLTAEVKRMNGINGIDGIGMGGMGTSDGMPAANLAWLLFAQTGMPGLYMLYSDLARGEERGIFD